MVHPDEQEAGRPGVSGGRRLRVGVVGTRTVAQGIGAYVARAFASAGCEVVALVGTSPATVAQARAELSRRYGLQCAGYEDVGARLGEEALDVLAICSPPGAHREALAAALEARVHVLCEKPLWWEADSGRRAGLAAEAEALARGFAERGRLLALNTQWPATLPTFRRLHPQAEKGGVRTFSMRLSPRGDVPGALPERLRRERLVIDAAPHALSLLQALVGHGRVEGASASAPAAAPAAAGGPPLAALDLRFTWRSAQLATRVELALRQCPEQPRPAGYAINGAWADREVDLPAYAMSLVARETPARKLPLPDPLDAHVADFVAGVAAGRRTDVEALVESLAALRDLVGVAVGSEEAA